MDDATIAIVIFVALSISLMLALWYGTKSQVDDVKASRSKDEMADVTDEAAKTDATTEDELREQIKREILEDLKAQGLKPMRRRFTTRQKWAIALFSLQTVAYAGSLVQVGVNVISAIAQAIGASVFMIIGAILLLTEKKEGK